MSDFMRFCVGSGVGGISYFLGRALGWDTAISQADPFGACVAMMYATGLVSVSLRGKKE